MKKIILSSDELKRVVKARENGLSWIRIQKEIGVPRRIAQREYEAFRRKESDRQLIEVRKEVAAQEYRSHMDLLTQLASSLTESLSTPEQFYNLRHAEEVVENLLRTDIYEERFLLRPGSADPRREAMVKRMNIILFKSLRDHTEGKVPWEALDKWKTARDKCMADVEKIKEELGGILGNILDQKLNLKDRILNLPKGTDVMGNVVAGSMVNIWIGYALGNTGVVTPWRGASAINKGTAWVEFHKRAPQHTRLDLDNQDADSNWQLANEIAGVCNWAIKNIGATQIVSDVQREVGSMQEAADRLNAVLNPLVLRPVILNTRCDICPIQ